MKIFRKKKTILRENGEPVFCLCHHRWYQILFKNPIISNRFYRFGWIDPEDWLEWWYLGVSPRIYFCGRKKWVNFPFLAWRDRQIWDHANAVKIDRKKDTDES